jgi:Putative Actinobacterial Holin-X, holin superfamily III
MSDASGPGDAANEVPAPAGDRLAEDIAAVIRQELNTLRGEWTQTLHSAGAGGLLLAAAAGCALLAVGAGSTTLLRILEAVLPRRLAAAGLTAGYLTAAAALAAAGLDRLRAAGGSSARLADAVRDELPATTRRLAGATRSAVDQTVRQPAA